ncbi:Permease of the drug/metabolite transporter (DMT) superfamily [Peptoclostridium litorale DSM 5388]|uniref:Transporter n=1 Tax=Peptoclostridium litorale DSM 5388 TaxID=1121324 RepID=A0A069RQU3_PEPLI|nr:DMT family transporter [Peptoclostridium litorale]KDR96552.1 transporter [Peptoclostridium litorale DSM 5388]SIN69226.1 Permease of the drug/metabolite transporter (DMT) superfamily [Peptoclostridium litorale DSM 5388]
MNRKKLYFLLILTVVFWGSSFAAVKLGAGKLSPVHFTFLRVTFASAIFSVILTGVSSEKKRIDKKDIPTIIYLGFMGIGGYFIVQYTALKYTTSVNASLLLGITPILLALHSCLVLEEKLEGLKIAGIAICFVGITLVITKGDISSFSFGKTIIGDALMILNAVMLAAFSLGAKKVLEKYDPFIIVAYINIAAMGMLVPVVFTSNFLSGASLIDNMEYIDIRAVLAALYLAGTCTVIGYYSWYSAIKEIGPVRTSVFNYINPFVASIASFAMFDEGITVFTVIGGISIIGGVALSSMGRSKSKIRHNVHIRGRVKTDESA